MYISSLKLLSHIALRSVKDARKFYFSNRAVDAWNHLPDHVVNATSLSSFNRRLSLTTVYQLIQLLLLCSTPVLLL